MILGRLKAKEEFDRVNSLNEEKRGSLPLWREIDQAYLSGGSGHELVTKWVTLGLIREHHPSLHEKRENMEVMAGGARTCAHRISGQPASCGTSKAIEVGYAEYFNYTERAEVINHGFV